MTPTKTPTELFIATARAYWLAAAELDQAASRHGDDFQRQAHKDFAALEKKLKTRIAEWNADLQPGEEHVSECRDAGSRSPQSVAKGHHAECVIFTPTRLLVDGRCVPCAAYAKWLAE